jgi:phosphopentomutase
MFRRVILIILDACGIGELPDADKYGDRGAATIPNIARQSGGLKMPSCGRLGMGNITSIKGLDPVDCPAGCFGMMAEKSPGKDSTSGHWEIGGIILDKPFPVYPNGFPKNLVEIFERTANVKTIGNIPASGTEIIQQLGGRHCQTGEIILYTSADSVFQLAAHEDISPLERLYDICMKAREILRGDHAVGRVIARPFTGKPGDFSRTANRRDFSLAPPSPTVFDIMKEKGIPSVAIGKIYELYACRGFSRAVKTTGNKEVMSRIIEQMTMVENGLIFANLVDFDMLWGHRNDTPSFKRGLEDFDCGLEDILSRLSGQDLLIITADHGCDPTLKHSTDHTREYVPLLAYNNRIRCGISLGRRDTFADVAVTLAEIFELNYNFPGRSFLESIVKTMEH